VSDDDALAEIAASLDSGMAIVTTVSVDGRTRAGCLVGFHAQCSIDPVRYVVWLSKANHTYRVGSLATRFGVHWLAEGDEDLAEHFGTLTGNDVDKFADVPWTDGGDGLPVLERVAHRLVARRHTLVDDGSDHVCLVLEPVEVTSAGPFSPLRFSAVRHLEAGHAAEERQVRP
jgi:flavin reductase (DIM6/NTAB) family NADH-FMN oxidoreductase RutF